MSSPPPALPSVFDVTTLYKCTSRQALVHSRTLTPRAPSDMFREFVASAVSTQYNMFKEIVVSAAIISSFLLNIAFVDHPDVSSYTIYFIISLLAIPLLLLLWNYVRSGNNFATCLRELGATVGIMNVSEDNPPQLMDGVAVVEGLDLTLRSLL